jgi:hypothetical protein
MFDPDDKAVQDAVAERLFRYAAERRGRRDAANDNASKPSAHYARQSTLEPEPN